MPFMVDDKTEKTAKLVKVLVLVVIGMFGFGFALVPLYDVLCEITGINGKGGDKQAIKESVYQVDTSREITVEFLTNLNKGTPLHFSVETKQLKVHPGEYYTVNFYAENLTDKNLRSQAIASFSPGLVTKYVEKIECFCFKQQDFLPRETKTMPMRFVVKPDLPNEYKIMTLSYTFFDNTKTLAQK